MITIRFNNGWSCRLHQPVCDFEITCVYWGDNALTHGVQVKVTHDKIVAFLGSIQERKPLSESTPRATPLSPRKGTPKGNKGATEKDITKALDDMLLDGERT